MSKTATYALIESQTLGSAAATVTFSNIPGTYTDLRLVMSAGETSSGSGGFITFNNDGGTGSLYSFTRMSGDGTNASSARGTNRNTNTWVFGNGIVVPTTPTDVSIVDIMDYANTTTNKTALNRENNAAGGIVANVILWRNTNAITRIDITYTGANFVAGSTFRLYGIQAGNA
jgi:hypothetical protein